jgi:FMN-dependent NADH-azoreductase
MPKLLVIEVSPRHDHSISRQLTAQFIAHWRQEYPDGEVVRRDLATTKLPYIDMAWIMGAFSPPETHSSESAAAMKLSDVLIGELKAADHIVIGTPMHNLTIPASLKAYIDHIVRVGATVSARNEGLVIGKKAAVILASGGDFSHGSPTEHFNHASPYLRVVLGFIGIQDLQIVLAGPTRPIMEGRETPSALLDRVDASLQTTVKSWATAIAAA